MPSLRLGGPKTFSIYWDKIRTMYFVNGGIAWSDWIRRVFREFYKIHVVYVNELDNIYMYRED